MTNETILKFKYPDTLISEYNRWVVLLRPGQITIGSLVLASKEEASRFSDLSLEAFAELKQVCGHLEAALTEAFQYDKINYLMLMMVDKHVHFHVFPRYSVPVTVDGAVYADEFWPGPPDVSRILDLSEEKLAAIRKKVIAAWRF